MENLTLTQGENCTNEYEAFKKFIDHVKENKGQPGWKRLRAEYFGDDLKDKDSTEFFVGSKGGIVGVSDKDDFDLWLRQRLNRTMRRMKMTNELLKELKSLDLFSLDEWDGAMGALFSIASEMFMRDLDIPSEWGYSPGMTDDPREPESIEFEACKEASDSDLEETGKMLNRYLDILKKQGKDY